MPKILLTLGAGSLGAVLAIHNPFTEWVSSESLAQTLRVNTFFAKIHHSVKPDSQGLSFLPVGDHALVPRERELELESGPTPDARVLISWIARANDNAGKMYAIVDKRQARVMLFSGRGTMIASAPALLGKAQGDDSAAGIGDKPLALIHEDEKTTPAGRFVSEPGFNADGEDVIWVDYQAAVSMHRVRTNHLAERRLERLASPSPADHRISFGCINVPAAFFDLHVKPMLGSAQSIVYVLPETRSIAAQFPSLSHWRGT